jgi:hypothetical protein
VRGAGIVDAWYVTVGCGGDGRCTTMYLVCKRGRGFFVPGRGFPRTCMIVEAPHGPQLQWLDRGKVIISILSDVSQVYKADLLLIGEAGFSVHS